MVIDFNIVPYDDKYFDEINKLNIEEGWRNLVEHKATFKNALKQSNAYAAVDNESNVLGYIRTITDQFITLFICELVVKMSYRSNGVGQALINEARRQYPTTRIELLATKSSATYHEKHKFRPFYGFRKSSDE
ncbi:GNAT family N-acetyltransferase [Staphylococcus kloosii]|uniref:GNAT family N-acetyltransferase n=1 Tax=Staphylococcus kloosii TaxID=29384 RepID=UPI00189D1224|nr:GNAT family N-acetyltransferase [Staphylococcus kloosii]MBF7022286.1 GNAT family N-acetyltransferase [Staphylococcus kloosii]